MERNEGGLSGRRERQLGGEEGGGEQAMREVEKMKEGER